VPTATGRPLWNASSVRKILVNSTYEGMAYGNQKQMVAARRRHPLIGREPKGEGGESCRLRPREDWIGVPVPALISSERCAEAQARLAQNRQWAKRRTEGQYLLRQLVSCRRCGLAHHICNHGVYAYAQCRGADTLIQRHRPEPCRARRIATARLDALVWTDLCQVVTEPAVLAEAVRRARQGWLSSDERTAQRHDLQRRQAEVTRQIQRLIDAYTAEAVTLEELGQQRRRLEERREALRRQEQQLITTTIQEYDLERIAVQAEAFRTRIADGLAHASFDQQRALVALLMDRVIVDAPAGEVRYVIPLTGIAERNGVLRLRHRAPHHGAETAQGGGGHLPQPGCGGAAGGGGARRAARSMAGGPALLQHRLARSPLPATAGAGSALARRRLRYQTRNHAGAD
jgi:site-specific DNA recombinase